VIRFCVLVSFTLSYATSWFAPFTSGVPVPAASPTVWVCTFCAM
jgi:hypothetical protein